MDIKAILGASIPVDLVDALLNSYSEIETNFIHRKWKASELDSGHFVEAARRIIEFRLLGSHTRIGTSLPNFNDNVLAKYAQAMGDESYRILIPRVLRSIYGVRNKRGVGHLGSISPNEMDATLILYNVKWVLAEIIRLGSGLSLADTQRAIDEVIEREVSLLWKDGDTVRVTDASLTAREQVLLYLYDVSPLSAADLASRCEYQNAHNFRKILKRLHDQKLILLKADSRCVLMPAGVAAAEEIMRGKA